MATFTKQNTFSAGAAASAAVNQNFDDIAAFLNNSVVHTDGSKAMTAPLSLPDADPTGPNQATRKSYVDTAVAHRSRFADGIHIGYTGNVNLHDFWEPLESSQSLVVTLNSSGYGHVTFPTPFPNGALTVLAQNGDGAAHANVTVDIIAMDKTGFDFHVVNAAGVELAGASFRVNYIAKGW